MTRGSHSFATAPTSAIIRSERMSMPGSAPFFRLGKKGTDPLCPRPVIPAHAGTQPPRPVIPRTRESSFKTSSPPPAKKPAGTSSPSSPSRSKANKSAPTAHSATSSTSTTATGKPKTPPTSSTKLLVNQAARLQAFATNIRYVDSVASSFAGPTSIDGGDGGPDGCICATAIARPNRDVMNIRKLSSAVGSRYSPRRPLSRAESMRQPASYSLALTSFVISNSYRFA
jgi:hypothetical protein